MYLFTNIFANAIQNLTKKEPKALVSGLGIAIPYIVLNGLYMYQSSLILTIFLLIMYQWKNMLDKSIIKRTTQTLVLVSLLHEQGT